MSGAENRAERSGLKIGWSGVELGEGVAENDGAEAERGAGVRGAGTERGAGSIGRSQPTPT